MQPTDQSRLKVSHYKSIEPFIMNQNRLKAFYLALTVIFGSMYYVLPFYNVTTSYINCDLVLYTGCGSLLVIL